MLHDWLHIAHRAFNSTWDFELVQTPLFLMNAVIIFLVSLFFIHKRTSAAHAREWGNDILMGVLATLLIALLVFLVQLFFISPARVYREAKNAERVASEEVDIATNQNSKVRQKNDSLVALIQQKDTTIQTLQSVNAQLQKKISDIDFARDPSAAGIKKRAGILTKEMFDFLEQWHINRPPTFGYGNTSQEEYMKNMKIWEDYETKQVGEFDRRFVGKNFIHARTAF